MCYLNPSWWAGVDGGPRELEGAVTTLYESAQMKLPAKLSQVQYTETIGLFEILFVVQFIVGSNSLRPHGLKHTRLPCPSPSPRICSNSWPLSRWCIISSYVEVDILYLREMYQLKNYVQPKSWEICFIQWVILGLQVQETASQVTLR